MPENDEDKAHPPLVDDDDGDEDITDVWDEEKLKAALGGLSTDEELGPATLSKRKSEASIQVADDLGAAGGESGRGPDHTPTPTQRPPSGGGLSWPITIGLAVTLAVAVYFLVTLLK